MKRLLCLSLAAALLAALALPASAEEASADARLARVTQAVKSTLSLNTDDYEDFHGGCSEELVPTWDLTWQAEDRTLSVCALEDGTIVNFYRWENDPTPISNRWAFPAFPENSGGSARALAEDFLHRVLRSNETAELKESEDGVSLGGSDSSWSGKLSINGLPSPFHWYISVENGQVSNFSRDVPEASVIGGVPSPEAPADASKAASDLADKLSVKLEYVLEDPGRAVLRYVPDNQHEFQVDAKTGGMIDVTALEENMSKNFSTTAGSAMDTAVEGEAAEAPADNGGLTEVEQAGVQELEGVLSKEELDKLLRAETAYGLYGCTLSSASYNVERDEGDSVVQCSLRYARTDNGKRLTRNITVDAKTGEVLRIWSSMPSDREIKLSEAQAKAKAEEFLKRFCPKDRAVEFYSSPDYGVSPLREQGVSSYSFTFARKENGVFFPSSYYNVSIDANDGSVCRLSINWDKDVTFDSPKGVVTEEAALTAWAGTFETILAYRNIPQKLVKSDPVQAKLIQEGAEYYYGLRLTYALEREKYCPGIDAKTGKPVQAETKNTRHTLSYTDLAGSSAKADIEKLAKYGVGYDAERFQPNKTLTQWDLVALLYSLQGTALNPDTTEGDAQDNAYFYAYRMGILRRPERDGGAVLTRAQLVKMLLDAAGYGPAARLEGIFSCDYADRASIPSGGLGYASLAQALGMASGTYAGSRSATRADAASMLCRLLERVS